MEQNSITLDEVKSHFEQWRATRSKLRERIPQYLWDEVKTLIDRYPLADITKNLRINNYQIKDNLKVNTKINFAEVSIDSLNSFQFPPLSFSGKETCSIELHRSNGVILKVTALPLVSIPKIISQFME